MNLPIDINAGQFLAFAALALATGMALGIAIGIELYNRYGRNMNARRGSVATR